MLLGTQQRMPIPEIFRRAGAGSAALAPAIQNSPQGKPLSGHLEGEELFRFSGIDGVGKVEQPVDIKGVGGQHRPVGQW